MMKVFGFFIIVFFFSVLTGLTIAVQSGNTLKWAGYISTSNSLSSTQVTGVNGSWIVQTASSTVNPSFSAQWIGIGGFGNENLLQIGTASNYSGGKPHYSAWYEMPYTQTPGPIPITTNIHANDKIKASIALSNGQNAINCDNKNCSWTLTINDISNSNDANTITLYFKSTLLSAEWIDEDPTCNWHNNCTAWENDNGVPANLSYFGTAYFGLNRTGVSQTDTANINSVTLPIGHFNYSRVSLISWQGSGTLAKTTNLTNNGTSFQVLRIGTPQLGVDNPVPTWQLAFQGQNALMTDGGGLGGTHNYTYQWLEGKAGITTIWPIPDFTYSDYSNSTDCASPHSVNCTFQTSNANSLLYSFELVVTDDFGEATSQPSYVIILPSENTSSHPIYRYYIPISITNNQASATSSPFQYLLTVNSLKYQTYEANNLQNVYFTYTNGSTIPSWIESNATNTSKYTHYWLKLAPAISSSGGTLQIYMQFVSKATNLFNAAGNTGEAPTLSPSYAEYDNGAEIFNYYDNFASSIGGWTEYNSSGAVNAFTIDNGITFNSMGGMGSYALVIGNNGIPTNVFFETYSTNNGGENWPENCEQGVTNPAFDALLSGSNMNSNGLIFSSYYFDLGNLGYDNTCYYSTLNYGDLYSNLTTVRRQGGTTGGGPGGIDWVSNTEEYWQNGGSIDIGYSNVIASAVNPPTLVYPAFGEGNFPGDGNPAWNTYATFYWVRTRQPSPDGVMPSATFGTVSKINETFLNGSLVLKGQYDTLKVLPMSTTDSMNVLLDGASVYSGAGIINYTFCAGSNVCPTVGIHNITINDNTANQTFHEVLIVSNAPIISTSANSVFLDLGQDVQITTNVTGGTGDFSYQWYNDSSGTLNAIANAILPTFWINATKTGNFTYNVILTDSGSLQAVNSIANIIVRVYPALNISSSANQTQLVLGKSALFTSTASGGSGNYLYQWMNVSNPWGVFFPINGKTANTFTLTANSVGTFFYALQVTDPATNQFFITNEIRITTLSPPSNIVYFVPINLTNNQTTPTPVPFQQMVTVNSLKYQSYETGNLMNIEFFYQNGTVIPSWLESGASNSATSTVYWLKLNIPIPEQYNIFTYMGLASLSTNLLSNTVTGAAPNYTSTYGQYDDGKNVFPFYDNFHGGTLNTSAWSASPGYTVSNGFIYKNCPICALSSIESFNALNSTVEMHGEFNET